MSTGNRLGPFVLSERVGTSVWLAEEPHQERPVALKLLTQQLPVDAAERESLVREVRGSSALYHTFLAPIIEVAEIDDALVLIMERVEGEPLSRRLRGAAASSAECFNLAYQLASALKYLHSRQITHANLNGDSLMITKEGKLVLGGLNMASLVRRGRSPHAFLAKRSDPRSVAYMAPEQITSGEVDARSDIYSAGVVLYEAATGCLPHSGRSAAEIAAAITHNPPVSPLAVNPAIPPQLLSVMGRCLFKDPEKRFFDPRLIAEAVEQAYPEAAEVARRFESGVTADAETEPGVSLLMLAEIAGDQMPPGEANAAAEASARMQVLLGETVHLFEGRVIDPLASQLVAELPSVENALEAGRKAEFELAGSTLPPVRLLLHAGAVEMEGGAAGGPAIERGLRTLRELPPGRLLISEDFVRHGRGNVRLRDAGALGGTKLFEVVPAEPPELSDVSVGEEDANSDSSDVDTQVTSPARKGVPAGQLFIAAAAVAAVALLAIVIAVVWVRRNGSDVPAVQSAAMAPAPDTAATALPQSIYIGPFTVEQDDPELVARAEAMRLASIAILRGYRDLRIVDRESSDSVVVTAAVRREADSAEIVTRRGARAAEPRPLPDAATGIAAVIEAATLDSRLEKQNAAEWEAINAFAEATRARTAGEIQKAERSLRSALAADPSFLPAQLLAMELFATLGRDADAVAAARQVIALDPANIDATRRVARASLITGDLRQAFALYALLLERNPRDAEALNHYARYALSAGDEARFTALLQRLGQVPVAFAAAHDPDRLAAAGRIDAAVQGYYAIEDESAGNPALALKIGRLAVLRHSLPIAELQLARLAQLDPLYGHHLLSAYIAAEKGARAQAIQELETALNAATPGDESWTAAAEIYTILADTRRTLESLERAARRKEPTAAYVLASPLFRYLANDARFQKVRATFADQQTEVREALQALQ